MRFVTLTEPLNGSERYARQIAGRGEYFSFDYSLIATPAVEGISVRHGDRYHVSFDAFWPEIKAGTTEGFNGLSTKGLRVCCIRLNLDLSNLRQISGSDPHRLIRNGMRWFIRERLAPRTAPIPPLRDEWLTPDVVALARGIHTTATLDGLPALTDALLEAGCDDPLAIEHLKTCPDHGPMCWVVDMICAQAARRDGTSG